MDWLIVLIPLLPLAGFTVNILFGRRVKTFSAVLATGLLATSFALSVMLFVKLLGDTTPMRVTLFEWIAVGDLGIRFAFLVDRLSAVMLLVVTGVGSLIHLYSIGYMHGDGRYSRFFAYMNLFAAMMLILVLADNYLVMFLGWEGVGLCSYLLIGFWFEKPFDKGTTNDAARKAFVVNRIGDFGFLVGLFLLWVTVRGAPAHLIDASLRGNLLSFETVQAIAALRDGMGQPMVITGAIATIITLLLFLGATGKSAQIPLYVWLPDAMAGPTPVSALIHAATMVTAGVYMIARSFFLFNLAPVSMTVVMWVGTGTALFAASMALQQNDIKKVLAYSTISQLGYMFAAVGAGAYALGIMHVMTHAFFKALLFLGAGAVIHALHDEQDITRMGGLKDKLPWVYRTFLAGALALAGFPLTAGFFSKDAILESVYAHGSTAAWAIGAATAGITAFYTFRLVFLTFFGSYRGKTDHPHGPGRTMMIPLLVLAFLSLFGGWVHIQAYHLFPKFGEFLAPVVGAMPSGEISHLEGTVLAVAVLVLVLGGIGLAWKLYGAGEVDAEAIAAEPSGLARVLRNKWYVDEAYDLVIIRPLKWVSRTVLWKIVDDWVIHGFLVQFCGGLFWKSAGFVVSFWQTGRAGTYAFGMTLGVLMLMLIWYLK